VKRPAAKRVVSGTRTKTKTKTALATKPAAPHGPQAPDSAALAGAVTAARAAREHAHAPYSRFHVGAAVIDERGQVHVGCNVENASYGLTTCAERNAIAAAVVAGARRITAVAIVTDADPLASPCGACRQVLAEFADAGALVILAAADDPRTVAHTVGGLLPDGFQFER
jgi:cytidine deaminase